MTRDEIWALITAERDRQEQIWAHVHDWGQGSCASLNVAPTVKAAVLAEECGEVARAVLDRESGDLETELVQIAAVAVAWLESLGRTRRPADQPVLFKDLKSERDYYRQRYEATFAVLNREIDGFVQAKTQAGIEAEVRRTVASEIEAEAQRCDTAIHDDDRAAWTGALRDAARIARQTQGASSDV